MDGGCQIICSTRNDVAATAHRQQFTQPDPAQSLSHVQRGGVLLRYTVDAHTVSERQRSGRQSSEGVGL